MFSGAQCRFVESNVVDPTIEGIAPIGSGANPKQAVVHGNRTGLVLRTRQNAVEVSFEFYSIVCGYEKMPVVRGNGIDSIVDVGSQKPVKGSKRCSSGVHLNKKRRVRALPLGKNLRPIRRCSVWLEPKGIGKPDSSLQVGMWTGVRVTSPELKSKPPTDLPAPQSVPELKRASTPFPVASDAVVPLDSSKVQRTSNSSLRTTASETVIWKIQMKANAKKGKRRDINDLI